MSYKKFILIAALTMLSCQLFAAEKIVNFWMVGTHDEVMVLEKLAEKFYQQTGIAVHIQPIPWGNFQTKYLTAMASGEPPDAGTSYLAAGLEYGKVGGVIDLEKNFPEEVARLKEKIFPDMWPICYFQNRLYAVPYNATALMCFYRKDIFRNLNLQPPQTWSEFEHILDVLTANNYQYGFLWTRNANWGIGTYVWPFGEDSYKNEGTLVDWTAPNFLKGYRFAIQLWNNYNLVMDKPIELMSIVDEKKALPLFVDYDMRYFEFLIRAPHLKNNFGIFPFPQADDGIPGTIMGGRTAVIFRDGRHPAEAMQWIEFLLLKESQLFIHKTMSNLGDRSQLFVSVNMDFWNEKIDLLPGDQQLFFQVYSRLKNKQGYPWLNESSRILEQSFFKVRNDLEGYLKKIADQNSLSVWDLKKAFAAGKMTAEKKKYAQFLNQTCEKVLKSSTVIAQQKLNLEREDYYQYYGIHLDNEIAVKQQWDVLDYSKLIAAILIGLFFAYVLIDRTARKQWISYLYIAPPIVAALVFIIIPIIVSLYLSFTKYNPIMPLNQAHWVGIENYVNILKDRVLWQSLGRSVYFAILVLPIQIFIAVILAACLDKNLIPDRLFKFVYFSPLVTSVVSISLIWFALYAETRYGWINSLLLNLNLIKDPILFIKDKGRFLNSVIIMSIWQGLAFTILIFLAGLQNVPKEHYEAAEIDGAGPIRQFFFISLPNLKPQFTFLVIMGTIGAVQVFEQIYMLGGGAAEAESKFGPDDCGMTIVPFLYRMGFEFFKMGEASAIAYILFLFLFLLTYLNLKFVTRRD
ncbi:MAG: extracellular solute-binding protein [bacterium]|nr:extracellular solute-binding protein [bacterium]